jgi:hypothetical protein
MIPQQKYQNRNACSGEEREKNAALLHLPKRDYTP